MKPSIENKTSAAGRLFAVALTAGLALSGGTARASVAYGSINNFDTVNDTGVPCHGFEIELDDIRSTDISYTFDYNHYGTPKITEFTSNDSLGLHTNVLVTYEAVWINGGWSAYTAVPTNNIPPTQGHAFTDPSLNFGGEHFGVGYLKNPTKVYYFWLTNSGGVLVRGPQVYVSTPVFTAPAPAQIVPVIPAPVLPLPPPPLSDPTLVYEFSDATWVKVIATTSHTNEPIALRDLITPDTNNPAAKDWRNGEPDQVETEWQLLQTDFKSASYNPTNGVGGMNGQLQNATNNLAHGDDVVTYRYEYYAYAGPYADLDTHEALAQNVAADGVHGTGIYTNTVVVGRFLGAQMSAASPAMPIGLINHLPDAELGVLYPTRAVVIAPDTNFTATCSGLPNGMTFDAANGWIGNTPSEAGVFLVTVTVTASNSPVLTKHYPLFVLDTGANPPPHCAVDTIASPLAGGVTGGDGIYTNDTTATVTAAPNAGYKFANWTDNGVIVSSAASYMFTNVLNRSLVANFVINLNPPMQLQPAGAHSFVITWPTNYAGFILQQNASLNPAGWTTATEAVSVASGNYRATVLTTNGPRFFRLMHP